MAGFDDPIEMDTAGVVLIGAVDIDNVRSVAFATDWSRDTEVRTVFQGKTRVRGSGLLSITVTLELYDDNTTNGNYKAFRIGHSSGIGTTITIRPLGTGAGLPELVLNPAVDQYGMDLIDAPWNAQSAENKPYVECTLTWEGDFTEQPAWAAQSA